MVRLASAAVEAADAKGIVPPLSIRPMRPSGSGARPHKQRRGRQDLWSLPIDRKPVAEKSSRTPLSARHHRDGGSGAPSSTFARLLDSQLKMKRPNTHPPTLKVSSGGILKRARAKKEADDARIIAMLAASTALQARVGARTPDANRAEYAREYSPLRASAVGAGSVDQKRLSSIRKRPVARARVIKQIARSEDADSRRALSARGDYDSGKHILESSRADSPVPKSPPRTNKTPPFKWRRKYRNAGGGGNEEQLLEVEPPLEVTSVGTDQSAEVASGRISPLVSPKNADKTSAKEINPFSFRAMKLPTRSNAPEAVASLVRAPSKEQGGGAYKFPLWQRKEKRLEVAAEARADSTSAKTPSSAEERIPESPTRRIPAARIAPAPTPASTPICAAQSPKPPKTTIKEELAGAQPVY